jgi:hypothetical protein
MSKRQGSAATGVKCRFIAVARQAEDRFDFYQINLMGAWVICQLPKLSPNVAL